MRSASTNVNRYVDAMQRRRALLTETMREVERVKVAHGALRGKQVHEAARILDDVVRLAEDYAVEVKVRRVTKKKKKANACDVIVSERP